MYYVVSTLAHIFSVAGLMLGSELFTLTDKLSKTLQQSRLSAAEGQTLAQTVVDAITARRNNGDRFYDKVLDQAKKFGKRTDYVYTKLLDALH